MKNIAPYQVFFPLGTLSALLAVGVWFVQGLGWFSTPAILIHGKLISGGFLWSFIIGFLMTAVPKMTGTKSASVVEYFISLLLMLSVITLSWRFDGKAFYTVQALLILFVLFYAGIRVLNKQKPIPVFFSHVGIGLTLALIGTFYYYNGYTFLGIHLYQVGTILLLVLGIGARFFSFLSGLPSLFENDKEKWKHYVFHIMGLLMALFLYCAGVGVTLAYLGLTLLSLGYLFFVWKVQRPSSRSSALKWSVRIVAGVIPFSFFLCWLYPSYFLTWLHILFISSFAMITFSVATRVTLAHGSYPTDFELKSPALWCLVVCLSLGTVARICYGILDGPMKSGFLHLAAALWFVGVGIWATSYVYKMFKPGPMRNPSC